MLGELAGAAFQDGADLAGGEAGADQDAELPLQLVGAWEEDHGRGAVRQRAHVVGDEPGRERRVVLHQGLVGDGGGRDHGHGAGQAEPEVHDGAVGFREGDEAPVRVVSEGPDDVEEAAEERGAGGARRRSRLLRAVVEVRSLCIDLCRVAMVNASNSVTV